MDTSVPGRSRLGDVLCTAGLVMNVVAPLALATSTPVLLAHHDLLLEGLSSSAVSIVTGGALARVGRASVVLVVLAPLCGVVLLDVFWWWAGRRWGERIVRSYTARSPRSRQWVERADQWVLAHGIRTLATAYFLPVPNALLFLSCGTALMPLRVFLLGDAMGTLLWTGALVGIGWGAGRHGVSIVDAVNRYALWMTVAVVIALVVGKVLRRRHTASY